MGLIADRYQDDRERGNAMAVALSGLALGVLGKTLHSTCTVPAPYLHSACTVPALYLYRTCILPVPFLSIICS